jgi:hypothetical protein
MTHRRGHSLTYDLYVRSPLWRLRRRLWILSTLGRCEDCRRWRCPLTMHHLTYKRLVHERRSDIRVLCRPCHKARHPHTRGGRRQRPLALRRSRRALRAVLLLASLVLLVHLAPMLLTLIPRHR